MHCDSLHLNTPNENVIISLTTIPSRSNKIIPTLNSLLNQSIPARIHIHIPEKANCEPFLKYDFPQEIQNHPNISIIKHALDFGPAMKFIPAIQQNKGKYILVVDDDNIYPFDLVKNLLGWSERDPSKVYCTRGWVHTLDYKWETTNTIFSDRISQPEPVSVITGCGGYMISPQIADKLKMFISDYQNVPRECQLMDDIWISGWLSRFSIKKEIIPTNQRFYPSLSTFFCQDHLTPERARKNNVVISYFMDSWKNDYLKNF